MKMKFKIHDISRPIASGMTVYPGNPGVKLVHTKTFTRDGQTLSLMVLGLHAATHLDAPLHMVHGGWSVEQVPLEKCMGWGRVVANDKWQMANDKEDAKIEGEDIRKIKPRKREIILFKTRNSNRKSSKLDRKFEKNFVYLTEDAAQALVRAKVKAVGIDGPSIKKFRLRPDTVHPLLLKAGIMIYEGLNLHSIKPSRYFFIGLPLKIAGGEASPVRAVLVQ